MRFKDFAHTSPSVKLEREKEYPFIPMDVVDGQRKFPVEIKRKKFSGGGAKFANGDTIFARITPCLENGKIAMIKNLEEGVGFGSTEFFVFRGKDEVSNSDFVYYLSRTDTIRDPAIKSMVGASGRQRADKSVVENLEVLVPSLSKQRDISDVLSTYDNLIENNTRRIQILEQTAQAVYAEWFVNFRFPGHEKIRMIDSQTDFGEIPEGWAVKKLGDVVYNFDSKRRPISKMKRAQMQGEIPYYGAAKIIDYVNDVLLDGKYLLFAEDGSVITKEGFPVLQFVNEKFWVSNHAHVLQGKEISTEYLYTALSKFPIQGYITGAAQPKITQENLNRIPMLIPDADTRTQFDAFIEPLFQLQFSLNNTLGNLRKTRDLLLPKLVNGEIEVSPI